MSYKNFICKFFFLLLGYISLNMFIMGMVYNLKDKINLIEWELMNLSSCKISMLILLDYKSLIFMSLVLFISSMVIYYSNYYMMMESNLDRFIILVILFVLSMMFLIISPNLVSILLGWDGLGLVSYCLVIYYQNMKSYSAGMLTALSNRIGDVMLLMSIGWMMSIGSWNYIFWFLFNEKWEFMLISVMIVVAALTKSAQIPFSSWLPAAMAAPTPVSALVHSSTLVTAGVYLLIRFYELIKMCDMLVYLLVIGCLTMFMAGVGANFEYDLKKIIALSTLSQLGLMIATIGMKMPELAFFHLLTHAMFKALLFLCAGVIIHNMNNNQDIRGMGSLIYHMPFTSICLNISSLALCGMPFLSGFYSKDLILEICLMSKLNIFIFFMYFISVGLSVMYSFRLIYFTMSSTFNYSSYFCFSEDWEAVKPMFVMSMMTVFGGCLLGWILLSTPYYIMMSMNLKMITVLVSMVGGFIGYEFAKMKNFLESIMFENYKMNDFFGSMWFMPYLSTQFISLYPLSMGGQFMKTVDLGWLEEFGGQGLFKFLMKSSFTNQMFQYNLVKIYLLSFYIWFIILVILYM